MAELQPGDTKRVLALQDVRNSKGDHIKHVQRVWLNSLRPGTYTAELKDSKGNVVEKIEIPATGSVYVEMRLQVYPGAD